MSTIFEAAGVVAKIGFEDKAKLPL